MSCISRMLPRGVLLRRSHSASLPVHARRYAPTVSAPALQIKAPLPRAGTAASARSLTSVVARASSTAKTPEAPAPDVDFIRSNANPYVKHCVKLRNNRSYREAVGRVIVTGVKPIQEVAGEGASRRVTVRMLFVAEWAEDLSGVKEVAAEQTIRVTEGVMKKLTGLESVAGVHAVAEMDVPEEEDLSAADVAPVYRLLVLEDVQDPGNVGTLLRTALAFGWDSLYLLPGCCDPFNEKVLRASRGAAFRMRRMSGSWLELNETVAAHRLRCLAAEPDPGAKFGARSASLGEAERPAEYEGVCLVLGNEGKGLSDTAIKACTPVSVPMPGEMESLNVGVAGGILMYLLRSGADDLLAFGAKPCIKF